jgi:hypothetical protein
MSLDSLPRCALNSLPDCEALDKSAIATDQTNMGVALAASMPPPDTQDSTDISVQATALSETPAVLKAPSCQIEPTEYHQSGTRVATTVALAVRPASRAGHRCFGCCCNMHTAAIVANVLSILGMIRMCQLLAQRDFAVAFVMGIGFIVIYLVGIYGASSSSKWCVVAALVADLANVLAANYYLNRENAVIAAALWILAAYPNAVYIREVDPPLSPSGHRCFGCCCDMDMAAIVANVLSIFGMIPFIWGLSHHVVAIVLGIALVGMYIAGIYGAASYSKWYVVAALVADLINAVTVSYYLHPERAVVAAALWILAAYPNAELISEVSERTSTS